MSSVFELEEYEFVRQVEGVEPQIKMENVDFSWGFKVKEV